MPPGETFVEHNRSHAALPAAALRSLRSRSEIAREVRLFFHEQGYWEVETPLLSRDVCVDRWLDPLEVEVGPERMYLQTSPEFAMKRLLIAGAEAIYQLTHAFRGTERGSRHNPEFTMLEWYRAGDSYEQQMDLVEALVRRVAAAEIDGPSPTLTPEPFERLSYDAAFQACLGRPVLNLPVEAIARLAESHGVRAPDSLKADDRDGWLNLLLAEKVEPWLADRRAVFLYDFPATQAALARVRHGDPAVAERFELYLGGFELCNGYQELLDPEELERRMQQQAELRLRSGLGRLPTGSRLVEAMRLGLPRCSGVALGFDRLVMWRLGARAIDEVIAFPLERA